jgi:hypothetical protein
VEFAIQFAGISHASVIVISAEDFLSQTVHRKRRWRENWLDWIVEKTDSYGDLITSDIWRKVHEFCFINQPQTSNFVLTAAYNPEPSNL